MPKGSAVPFADIKAALDIPLEQVRENVTSLGNLQVHSRYRM
jgi:hypothetical protein